MTNLPSAAERPAPTGLRALIARFEHLLRELSKFGTVGIIAFAVDFGIFNLLLVVLDVNYMVSATVSMVVAATVAFIGNRFWTWRDRERSGLRREYTLYFIFNLIGLGIVLACLTISHEILGSIWPVLQTKLADNVSKNLVGMAFASVFRFWAYRHIVFRKTSSDPTPAGPSAG